MYLESIHADPDLIEGLRNEKEYTEAMMKINFEMAKVQNHKLFFEGQIAPMKIGTVLFENTVGALGRFYVETVTGTRSPSGPQEYLETQQNASHDAITLITDEYYKKISNKILGDELKKKSIDVQKAITQIKLY